MENCFAAPSDSRRPSPACATTGSRSRLGRWPGLILAWQLTLMAGCVASTSNPVPGNGEIPLDIGVRSSVDKPFGGFHRQPPPVHGKVYLIAAVKEAPSPLKLVKRVDERGVVKALRQELNSRGYREITKDQTPEIVLTVVYGRGWLRNPYLADVIVNEMTNPPTVTIIGGMPTQLLKEREVGFESKLQKAQFEKLFIRVTAWKYPSAPKEKPQELWKTTMNIDDPDNRDLNEVYKAMLAAGAPYFDREIAQEEVDVLKPLPEGHVKVGTPEIVKP
jgi:hypothetical protein